MKRKLNNEIKLGLIILSSFLLWSLCWIIYSFFIQGTPIHPYYPVANMEIELLKPMEKGFLLGTDIYGRSIAELLSSGLVYSLCIGISISLISSTIGIVLGYLCVVGNSVVKNLSELLMNLIFIFPSILIAILVMAIVERSIWGLVFALTITGWPGYARIARGESQRVMSLSYIESAKAIGVSGFSLFTFHVFPSILPMILIHVVLGMSGVIISEATLGFLGLGGSEYSWGNLLSMSKTVLLEAPHLVVVISMTLALLIIGLNLLGDGLRDYLDPKSNFS